MMMEGGLRLSIYYYTNLRLYSEPYHICTSAAAGTSYDEVETDLVNFTSCVGYELWRFSTTCTLVLQSVKATSVIFLLGVGSFVCYRLYHRYKRRSGSDDDEENSTGPSSGSSGSKRPRLVHWVSRELLESCLNSDDELQDIKREYFGPADHRDDNSLPTTYTKLDDHGRHHEHFSSGIVSRHEMGLSHSSSATAATDARGELVTYNNCLGIHLPNPRNCMHESRQQLMELQPTPRRKRPDSLPLRHCHREAARKSRSEADGSEGAPQRSPLKKSDSVDSFCDLDSPKCRVSEDEDDGDDEGGGDDDESFLTHSGFQSHLGDIDDYSQTCSSSLKVNFSPSSLLNRRFLVSPIAGPDDRLPPDGLERRLTGESVGGGGGGYDDRDRIEPLLEDFLVDCPKSSSSSDDVRFLEDEKSDRFGGDDLSVMSSGHGEFCGCDAFLHRIPRDCSFGSECSEITVDTFVFNQIGETTQGRIERLQEEIDQVRKDCEDLENFMENVNVHGPMPSIYTELVISPLLSDVSEGSDNQAPFQKEPVVVAADSQLIKRRSAFRQTHIKSSCDTSLDRHSSTSSSRVANISGNVSLEWESMKGSSSSSVGGCGDVSLQSVHCKRVSNCNNGSIVHRDSGSEFGTPLTSGSPEPCRRKRSGSVASLEWDEEFENGIEEVEDVPHRTVADDLDLPKNEKNSKRNFLSPSKQPDPVHKLICDQQSGEQLLISTKVNDAKSPMTLGLTCEDMLVWSSMESGYIDEFSESSRQVSPQDVSSTGNVDTGAKSGQSVAAKPRQHEMPIRTWPVVGGRKSLRSFVRNFNSIRKEFFAASQHLGFKHLRPILDDHYCALRATVVQALSQGFSVLENGSGIGHMKKKLGTWMRSHCPWMRKWNFARRIPYNQDDCLQKMLDCMETLDWLVSCVLSSVNREDVAVHTLNTDPEVDVQTMESLKLLMLCSAIELYQEMLVDGHVPSFVQTIYARATSPTPEAFLVNHLNGIGHTCGLGPLELSLLGFSIGATICVMNPSKQERNREFISYFPDYDMGSRPEIYLLSEDGSRFCVMSK